MSTNDGLRDHLHKLLAGRGAHLDLETLLSKLQFSLLGSKPDRAPRTPWELFEHMRIAQWDILEFSRDPAHVSPRFPEGYWPDSARPENEAAWNESLQAFRDDLAGMQALVADPSIDLMAPLAHGTGQTILREALVTADHNAYHMGQIVLLLKQMGAW